MTRSRGIEQDRMSPHVKRWITGIIAAPLLFLIIWYGSEEVFAAFIVLVVLAAFHEYNKLVFGSAHFWEKWIGMVLALFIPTAVFTGNTRLILAVVALSVLSAFIIFLSQIKDPSFNINPLGKLVLGLMYVPFMLSHFILIRQAENGVLWVFFILVLAFSGDIAAYYVGKSIGKRKLIPAVSPGKTVEGTLGLIAGSTAACVLFKALFFPALPLIHALILGFLGSIIGQLGDLCESAIKRASGVKDSGSILLGHGGLLDRLDCLIFIAPFVYYYQSFLVK
ncbi:MAG: phosphatidate cytidylyltransferase [Deltaproteobacteria bacterium]|nr:phosphatidate cytidylyltransferase [Deltaproteobacteria bacterium]